MTTGSSNVINVLIVDDHRAFSDSLNDMLESDAGISVLAQVHDSREAKEQIATHHPDVVLMDYNMPHLNGLELTRLLLGERPDLKVLFISLYNEERLIESFKSAGARGYVFKTASADEVLRATRTVHTGEYYFPETSTGAKPVADGSSEKPKLSDREMEFVQLMKAGLKTREIAEKLNISPYTAETQRNNIKLKAGVKSETEFIRFIFGM